MIDDGAHEDVAAECECFLCQNAADIEDAEIRGVRCPECGGDMPCDHPQGPR